MKNRKYPESNSKSVCSCNLSSDNNRYFWISTTGSQTAVVKITIKFQGTIDFHIWSARTGYHFHTACKNMHFSL